MVHTGRAGVQRALGRTRGPTAAQEGADAPPWPEEPRGTRPPAAAPAHQPVSRPQPHPAGPLAQGQPLPDAATERPARGARVRTAEPRTGSGCCPSAPASAPSPLTRHGEEDGAGRAGPRGALGRAPSPRVSRGPAARPSAPGARVSCGPPSLRRGLVRSAGPGLARRRGLAVPVLSLQEPPSDCGC